jgi:hypothetical protein
MLYSRVVKDLARELGMTCGNKNKLKGAGGHDLLELLLRDIVCNPIVLFEDKAVALVLIEIVVLP